MLAALLALIPAAVSYGEMLAGRSNSSLGIRSVEWMRANGAQALVSQIENIYYSMTAPSKGGPALHALPHQSAALGGGSGSAAGGKSATGAHRHKPAYRPPPIMPIIHPALPGEGRWHATLADGGNPPPVLITSFRPDPSYPQLVAGVAWINRTRTSVQLYPGIQEPSVTMPSRGPEEVPTTMRSRLVATFNSAFQLVDSNGGFAYGGHTYAAMHNDMGTVLRYRDGRMNIVNWTGGPTVGPNVDYARQNLPLIIDHGRLNPNLSSGPQWGATLGNAVLVWRSGLGIDRHGNLIYAAADDLTVTMLAHILQHAGAVRAMELDINAYWPSFITYRHPGASDPANLLSGMQRSPYRYLTPDDRDFFAVYLKK